MKIYSYKDTQELIYKKLRGNNDTTTWNVRFWNNSVDNCWIDHFNKLY